MDTLNQVPTGINPGSPMPNVTIHESLPQKKNSSLLLIILVIVGVVAWLAYSHFYSRTSKVESHLQAAAPAGELVSGLPIDIVLYKDATILNSQSKILKVEDRSFQLLMLEYTTKSSDENIISDYFEYMQKNGYELKKRTLKGGAGQIAGARKIPDMKAISVSFHKMNAEGLMDIKISFSSPIIN